MKRHPGGTFALMLVLLAPPLSAQVRARENVILRQPVERAIIRRPQMLTNVDPLAGLSITPSPAAPSLPSPAFQITSFSRANGAHNDVQGNTIRTSLTSLSAADFKTCPLTPIFSFGSGQPTVPAAGFYPNTASTAPATEKYTWISGTLYFRPPVLPDAVFPGGLASPPQTTNSWVHVVNCRNEYSNALAFRVEPSAFQITKVHPDGFIGGQQIVVSGSGLEGKKSCGSTWCTPTQKVMFTFKLGKNNQTNTGLDVVERELEAPQMTSPSLDERYTNVYAPSLEGQGYTRTSWVLLESKVYVVKDGLRSNALPARYCSSAANTSLTGACW